MRSNQTSKTHIAAGQIEYQTKIVLIQNNSRLGGIQGLFPAGLRGLAGAPGGAIATFDRGAFNPACREIIDRLVEELMAHYWRTTLKL